MVFLIDPSDLLIKKCPSYCEDKAPGCNPRFVPLYGIDPNPDPE